jgi:hypothetical protein
MGKSSMKMKNILKHCCALKVEELEKIEVSLKEINFGNVFIGSCLE